MIAVLTALPSEPLLETISMPLALIRQSALFSTSVKNDAPAPLLTSKTRSHPPFRIPFNQGPHGPRIGRAVEQPLMPWNRGI
jgi:hypothetical protein